MKVAHFTLETMHEVLSMFKVAVTVTLIYNASSHSKNARCILTYGKCWWVDDGVDHHNLLQKGGHCAKGMPEHGCQVRKDLSLPTQLDESMLPCLRAG